MQVRLRPARAEDLPTLTGARSRESDPFGFFGHTATNGLERRYATDGLLSEDAGLLVVENEHGELIGEVGWMAVQHGPSRACRALNIGIGLVPEARGHGYGTLAQAALATYLFDTTLVERLEAGTDTDNVAEQRALERAGFRREGVLRHAQFRDGKWRDMVMYSRLRDDPAPSQSDWT
jgi:RimJ/RimL family protein N-acetyltransferase